MQFAMSELLGERIVCVVHVVWSYPVTFLCKFEFIAIFDHFLFSEFLFWQTKKLKTETADGKFEVFQTFGTLFFLKKN